MLAFALGVLPDLNGFHPSTGNSNTSDFPQVCQYLSLYLELSPSI